MTEIVYSEMVGTLAKDGDEILEGMTGDMMHLTHMVIGVVGESTELLDALRMDDLDYENITEELGDSEFYLEGLRQGLGIVRPKGSQDTRVPNPMGLMMVGVSYAVNAGLLLDCIKRYTIYRKVIELDRIVGVLTDIETDLVAIRHLCGITWDDTIRHNVGKLGKRYKGFVYTDKAAQLRADKV